MYNKIVLLGNLTRDVTVKYTQGGSAIGNTAIAITRKFKSQTGEQKEEVLFVDLTFFGRIAEIANQYLRKGSKVLVDGRLKLDQWTDQQSGAKRSKHSVTVENLQMLDSKQDAPQQNRETPDRNPEGSPYYGASGVPAQTAQASSQPAPSSVPEIDIDEDFIPF